MALHLKSCVATDCCHPIYIYIYSLVIIILISTGISGASAKVQEASNAQQGKMPQRKSSKRQKIDKQI